MTINGISGANTQAGQMGMNQAADSCSRNIQNQIASAQKQLQEISSNENMSLEEKMKKRQEIQQQISGLNVQLRQRQMEQRREKQQAKGSSMDEMLGGTSNAKSKGTGLSQASMTAMISSDNSIKQAKVQGSVATSMEDRAGVLKSEIKYSHGGSVEKMKEELADVEQKAQAATSSQLSTLADAVKTVKEAAKADSRTEKTDNKNAKTDGRTEKTDNKNAETDGRTEKTDDKNAKTTGAKENGSDENTAPQPMVSTSVDIRL